MIFRSTEVGFIGGLLSSAFAIAAGHPQKVARGNRAAKEGQLVQQHTDKIIAEAAAIQSQADRKRAEQRTALMTVGALAVAGAAIVWVAGRRG